MDGMDVVNFYGWIVGQNIACQVRVDDIVRSDATIL